MGREIESRQVRCMVVAFLKRTHECAQLYTWLLNYIPKIEVKGPRFEPRPGWPGTACRNVKMHSIQKLPTVAAQYLRCKIVQRWRCSRLTIVGLAPEKKLKIEPN
jgi:hypothetical protein